MQKNIRNRNSDIIKKKISVIFKAACVIILLIIGIKYLYDRENVPEDEPKGYEAGDSGFSTVKEKDTRDSRNETRKSEPAKVTSAPSVTKTEDASDENIGDDPQGVGDDLGSSDTESRLYDENGRLNINVAGKTDLMKLNGIGEKRAQDIIDYREKNGGFKSIEEIMKVKGIKQGIFSKLKDQIFAG